MIRFLFSKYILEIDSIYTMLYSVSINNVTIELPSSNSMNACYYCSLNGLLQY